MLNDKITDIIKNTNSFNVKKLYHSKNKKSEEICFLLYSKNIDDYFKEKNLKYEFTTYHGYRGILFDNIILYHTYNDIKCNDIYYHNKTLFNDLKMIYQKDNELMKIIKNKIENLYGYDCCEVNFYCNQIIINISR